MSTVHKFECLICKKSSGFEFPGGYLRYKFGENRVLDIQTIPAWCRDCDRVTAVERLPPLAAFDREIAEVSAATSALLSGLTWKERLAIQLPWDEKGQRLAELIRRREKIEELRLFFAGRRSPPRCVVCGSTDSVSVEGLVRRFEGVDVPRHPGCGGPLAYLSYEDGRPLVNGFPNITVRLYDREGNFVSLG